MTFSHKYGEKTCWDQCEATKPKDPTTTPAPTTPPPSCKPLFSKIFISNATSPHPYVPGADINVALKSTSNMNEFSKITDSNGLVRFTEDPTKQPSLVSGQTYTVQIAKKGFLEKTVNVHLHCEPREYNELCPKCYFTELVKRTTIAPAITTLKAESTTSGKEAKKGNGTTEQPGAKTQPPVKPTKKLRGTTTETEAKETTKGRGNGKETTQGGKQTQPGTEAPTKAPTEAPTKTGQKTTTKTFQYKVGTTQRAVVQTTTSIYKREKYPKCGDKDFVNPGNQLICDCSEDKCDQAKKLISGKCEPCIDIPLIEVITTTTIPGTTTTCEGPNCTTPPSTTPPPTTTPCTQAMDKKIKITVIDHVTGIFIEQANVTLTQINPKYGFVGQDFTEKGETTFGVSEDGNFTVILNKPGYEDSKKDVTINCNEQHGCLCSADITANLTKIDPCKEGSSIKVKVRRYVGTPFSQGGSNTEDVTNFGTGEKDTKITVIGTNNKNVTGVLNKTTNFVVFDVTGGVPDVYTIDVKNVGIDTGKIYDPKSKSIKFEMCKYATDSTMEEDCCTKQHEIVVDFEPPTTTTITTETTVSTTTCEGPECTTPTTTIPTTTTACPYKTEDKFHVSFCGDITNYKQKFGEPTVAFTDRGKITSKVALDTITSGERRGGNCTGEYADKLLIKEYEPDLIARRISRAEMKIEVTGEHFKTTSNEIMMDCSDVKGCNNCSARLQVLVVPVCSTGKKEFFTIEITNDEDPAVPLEGVTVITKKNDGTPYITKTTDSKGMLKIKFDRTLENLKLTISKKGYETVETEGVLVCDKAVPCGQCKPKLKKQIKKKNPCTEDMKKDMKIRVTTNEEGTGYPVEGAKIIVTNSDDSVVTNGNDITDSKGKATIEIETNGEYSVKILPNSHSSKVKTAIVKECKPTNVTFTLHPNPSTTSPLSTPISTTPCIYDHKDVEIKFKVLDISATKNGKPLNLDGAKISVHYIEKNGQVKNEILIEERMKTNGLGELRVPASTNGNYTFSIAKQGFEKDPTVGWVEVDCDCQTKEKCEPEVTVQLEEDRCDPNIFKKNFCVNVTSYNDHSVVPGATVRLTLKRYRGQTISNVIGTPQITPDNGMVCYDAPVSGIYWLEVTQTNYKPFNEKMNLTCNVEECQTCNQTELVPLRKEACPAELTVVVKCAKDNTIVENAMVKATRAGIDNGVTKHVITTKTNATGIAKIPLNDNGEYTFEVESKPLKKTYTGNHHVNLTANSQDCEAYKPIYPVPLTCENICDNGVQLSLTWRKEPVDLDLYSFRVLNSDSSQYCQTYWCDKKEQCGCTTFDTDNMYKGGLSSGGAETITLCCEDIYSYMIYVDDRTGNGEHLPGSEVKLHLQSNLKYALKELERPSTTSTTNKRYGKNYQIYWFLKFCNTI